MSAGDDVARAAEVAGNDVREVIAAIIARSASGSLYPWLGVPGDCPVTMEDYRAADAILAHLQDQTPAVETNTFNEDHR